MKKVTAETLFEIPCLGKPIFSTDGKYLAYTLQTAQRKENQYQRRIHLYELESGKDWVPYEAENENFWGWDPENCLLFGLAGRNGNGTRLRHVDVDGNIRYEEWIPLLVRGLEVAGNRRFALLAECRKEALPEEGTYEVMEELPFWNNGIGFTDGLRRRIFLWEQDSGKISAVTGSDFQTEGFHTDGVHIIFWGCSEKLWKAETGVYSYEIASGRKEEIVAPGEMKITFADLWNGNALLAMTDGSCHGKNQYPDFYRYSFADKKTEFFCPVGEAVGISAVSTDCRLGWGQGTRAAEDGYYFLMTRRHGTVLKRLEKNGSLSGDLTPEGVCDGFDYLDGQIAFSGMFGTGLTELYLNGCQISWWNQGFYVQYQVQKPECLSLRDSEGTEVFGWILPPVDPPEGLCPAILSIHGGPHDSFGPIFHQEMQSLAAAGYYVFYCNPKGSSGYGSAFADLTGQYGTIDYETLMCFTDQVLERYPQIDPNRLGVMGGSYGGFMVNWIITHTDRFRAAVSDRCISNWVSHEHTSDIGPRYTRQELGALTSEHAGYLWSVSPLCYAGRVKTPTLFIHGDQDYRCFMGEGLAMFSALKRSGVETRMCLFHGENHDLCRSGKPLNRLVRMQEVQKWLNHYLQPGAN